MSIHKKSFATFSSIAFMMFAILFYQNCGNQGLQAIDQASTTNASQSGNNSDRGIFLQFDEQGLIPELKVNRTEVYNDPQCGSSSFAAELHGPSDEPELRESARSVLVLWSQLDRSKIIKDEKKRYRYGVHPRTTESSATYYVNVPVKNGFANYSLPGEISAEGIPAGEYDLYAYYDPETWTLLKDCSSPFQLGSALFCEATTPNLWAPGTSNGISAPIYSNIHKLVVKDCTGGPDLQLKVSGQTVDFAELSFESPPPLPVLSRHHKISFQINRKTIDVQATLTVGNSKYNNIKSCNLNFGLSNPVSLDFIAKVEKLSICPKSTPVPGSLFEEVWKLEYQNSPIAHISSQTSRFCDLNALKEVHDEINHLLKALDLSQCSPHILPLFP